MIPIMLFKIVNPINIHLNRFYFPMQVLKNIIALHIISQKPLCIYVLPRSKDIN